MNDSFAMGLGLGRRAGFACLVLTILASSPGLAHGHGSARAVRAPAEAFAPERAGLRAGQITEYPLPASIFGEIWQITLGPDRALWFTIWQGNMVGRITTAGRATIYQTPTQGSVPWGIAAGSDGALWFTESNVCKIGRITTRGHITEYPQPKGCLERGITPGPDGALWFVQPFYVGRITVQGQSTFFQTRMGDAIVAGPDGALWFSNDDDSLPGVGITRITTSGEITRHTIPGGAVEGLAVGPDGRIWFTQSSGCTVASVGNITTSGVITQYQAVPCTQPYGIAAGPDGALWFTELHGGHVDRITTNGVITRYKVPTTHAAPRGITAGPDGAMWFTESQPTAHNIGRITTGVK